jgi:tRNA A-37 threonylcarbamoyl transferase component Bud32
MPPAPTVARGAPIDLGGAAGYPQPPLKTCPTCRVHLPDALDFCPQDGTNLTGQPGRTEVLFDRFLGTVIDGRYKIESKLGEGGMGVVYAARHVIIDKRVAIKVLKKEAQTEETAGQRFIQEARAASRIGHANIVDITDFGTTADGSAYFVMEFLDGKTLGQLLASGPLPARRALTVATQVARGLLAAHRSGIVHRDLKPDNIFLVERDGQPDAVKVVDFGIAKVQSQGTAERLTQAGMVLGTPEYMAPEAATGKETDHRVDEYSLGCILYEMLTGEVPFKGTNSQATLTKHVFEAAVPPSKRRPDLDVPPTLEAVVLRAMAKKPDDRYPSMRELVEALDQAAERDGLALPRRAREGRSEQIAAVAEPRSEAGDGIPTEELPAPRRLGRALALGLAGGGALATVGMAAWMALRPPASAPPLRAAAATAAAAPAPAVAAPVSPAVAPAAAAEVTLTLRSSPPGAAVLEKGERLGLTPLSLRRPAQVRPVTLLFRLAGYKDVERVLVADANHDVEVVLAARPAHHVARVPGGHAGQARKKPAGEAPVKRGPAADLRDPFP